MKRPEYKNSTSLPTIEDWKAACWKSQVWANDERWVSTARRRGRARLHTLIAGLIVLAAWIVFLYLRGVFS